MRPTTRPIRPPAVAVRARALAWALGAWALGACASAAADAADARVAFLTGHVGEAWSRASLVAWGEVAESAAREGAVAAADAYPTESPDPALQAAALRELAAAGYDAIVVDALSATALDAAVAEACAAGALVISVRGTVGAPCAWRLAPDYRRMGRGQVEWLAAHLPEGGNLLEVRGAEGTAADAGIAAGVRAAVAAHDRFEIAASVRGGTTREDARAAIEAALPGLPPVVGVVAAGGDGLGIAEAFEAAGREVPPILLGNRHEELAWWRERAGRDGYETMSEAPAPGLSTLGFWVAERLLEGVPVPKALVVVPLRVERETLDSALALTEHDGVHDALYARESVRGLVAAAD